MSLPRTRRADAPRRATALVGAALLLAACGPDSARDTSPTREPGAESPASGAADADALRPAGDDPSSTRLLAAPPLLGRVTRDAAALALIAGAEPVALALHVGGRAEPAAVASLAAGEARRLAFDGLPPGTSTEWRLDVRTRDAEEHLGGRVTTARAPGVSFTFAVISDSHLPAPPAHWLQPGVEREPWVVASFESGHAVTSGVLDAVMASVRAARPDFVVHLGDMLDGHMLGDNAPFPTVDVGRAAYLDLRRHLGSAGAEAAFFAVLGNWDGENGWHPPELVANARAARHELIPNPDATTYPEGGSPREDYYAWCWGDALLVALDVQSYTSTAHGLDDTEGRADDWTLGAEQLAWFERTLAASDARHVIVLAHHAVGGAGGDEGESRYGRGGGRAAHVGEQAIVQRLMVEHGACMFLYGHDHVFTSMTVDGVSYVLPGSAGAPWKFGSDLTGYERFDERSGFGLVHVTPDELTVDFCDVDGEVFETLRVAARER